MGPRLLSLPGSDAGAAHRSSAVVAEGKREGGRRCGGVLHRHHAVALPPAWLRAAGSRTAVWPPPVRRARRGADEAAQRLVSRRVELRRRVRHAAGERTFDVRRRRGRWTRVRVQPHERAGDSRRSDAIDDQREPGDDQRAARRPRGAVPVSSRTAMTLTPSAYALLGLTALVAALVAVL